MVILYPNLSPFLCTHAQRTQTGGRYVHESVARSIEASCVVCKGGMSACSPPELAELSRALDKLSQEKVRYLCVLLGVRPATLSNIDEGNRGAPLTCITKYLEAWLASADAPLSWDVIASGLRCEKLRETALAVKIEETYCRPAHNPLASTAVSHESSESEDLRDTHVLANYSTPPSPQESTESCSQLQADPPSPPNEGQKIAQKITHHKELFRAIVIETITYLSQQMSQHDFERFKIDLTIMPMMGETHQLLQEESEKIMRAKCVHEIFQILKPYMNHVDYALLEHIVLKYCNSVIKGLMVEYKLILHHFEKETSAKHFISSGAKSNQVPPHYSTLKTTVGMDAEKCSLYHVRMVKESIAVKANLKPYTTMLQDIQESSVLLTIAFPPEVFYSLKSSLDPVFLSKLGIKPDSLQFLMHSGSVPICTEVPYSEV